MKNNDQRSSVVWLVIGLGIAFYSVKYGLGKLSSPGPGFMPFLSGVAVAGLAAVVFLHQWARESHEDLKHLWRGKDWLTMLKILAALVLYASFLKDLGFLLVTFLLIVYLFRVIRPMGWIKVLSGAFLTAFGSYAVFELWLQAQLPRGVFGF